MDSLDLPDLTKQLTPVELCKQGKFEDLFAIYDELEGLKVSIHGYLPSDTLSKHQVIIDEREYRGLHGKNLDVEQELDCQPIHYAVAHGNLSAVRKLVDEYRCPPGYSSLFIAIYYGHFEVVKYLVKLCNCHPKYDHGFFAYVCNAVTCIESNYKTRTRFMGIIPNVEFRYDLIDGDVMQHDHNKAKIALFLLESGQMTSDNYQITTLVLKFVLLCGKYEDLINLVNCHRLDLNKVFNFENGKSLFTEYCFFGNNLTLVEELLAKGVLVSNVDVIRCALDCFAGEPLISLLISKCQSNPIFECGSSDETLFNYIMHIFGLSYYNQRNCVADLSLLYPIIDKFGDAQDSNGQNLLHHACNKYKSVKLARLISKVKPHLQRMQDINLQLPLHLVCSNHIAREDVKFELIDLTSSDCDVNTLDKDGNNPLHCAIILRESETLDRLFNNKEFSLTMKNKHGLIPLHDACCMIQDINLESIHFDDINQVDKDGNTFLHVACTYNVSLIKYLVCHLNASIKVRNTEGNLPLHCFSFFGVNSSKVVNELLWLLSNNILINLPDSMGNTVLHKVLTYTSDKSLCYEIIQYLVGTLHASIEVPNSKGSLPIHVVVSWDWKHQSKTMKNIIDILINSDVVVNSQDLNGNTALHIACMKCTHNNLSHVLLVEYLVKQKHASLNLSNHNHNLPIHIILQHTNISAHMVKSLNIKLLLEDIDINLPDSKGNTPLHLACMNGTTILIAYLIQSKGALVTVKNNHDQLPLHLFLKRRYCTDISVVKLLATGVNLSTSDKEENTPLHIACYSWTSEVDLGVECLKHSQNSNHFWHVDDGFRALLLISKVSFPLCLSFNDFQSHLSSIIVHEDVFQLLSMRNSCTYTPFQILINSKAEFLLKCFLTILDLNNNHYRNEIGNDLRLHAMCHEDHLDVLKALVNGTNAKNKNSHGELLLHVACKIRKPGIDILQYNIPMSDDDVKNPCIDILRCIPMSDDDVNEQDEFGKTPLHVAFETGNIDTIKYLLEHGNCIQNKKDKHGNLPLHYACKQTIEHVKLLNISNEDYHVLNEDGLAPIHVAVQNNQVDVVKYFILQYKSNLFFKSGKDGRLPIELLAECQLMSWSLRFNEMTAHFAEQECSYGNSSNYCRAVLVKLACNVSFIETLKYLKEQRTFLAHNCSLRCPPYRDINRVSLLHAAAWCGRIDILQYLINDEKCDPCSTDAEGHNTLVYACGIPAYKIMMWDFKLSEASIHLLLDNGCSLFDEINDDFEPDHDVFRHACAFQKIDLIKALNSTSDSINCQDANGNTPLMVLLQHKYLNLDFVNNSSRILIEDRACDQSITNHNSKDALCFACRNDVFLDTIKVMDYSRIIRHSLKPLKIACKTGSEEIVKYLVDKCCIKESHYQMISLLQISFSHDKHSLALFFLKKISFKQIMKYETQLSLPLLTYCLENVYELDINKEYLHGNSIDSLDNTLLHIACKYNLADAVIKLKTYDLDKRNNNWDTPLHVACEFGSHECVSALDSGVLDIRNNSGDTPLHIVCQKGSFKTLQLLLNQFSNVENAIKTRNKQGILPLYLALKQFEGESATLSMLKSLFIMVKETTSVTCDNDELLHLVCQSKNVNYTKIAVYLKSTGRSLSHSDSHGKLPIHYACTVSLNLVKVCTSPSTIDMQDRDGNTPLHISCACGKYDICKYLIVDMKCNTAIQNRKNQVALHEACKADTVDIDIIGMLLSQTKSFLPGNLFHLLCKNFDNMELSVFSLMFATIERKKQCHIFPQPNEFGELPLHILCKSRKHDAIEAVKALLPYGNLNAQTLSGDTPLHHACLSERHDIIKLLSTNETAPSDIKKINNTAQLLPIHLACSMPVILDLKERVKWVYEPNSERVKSQQKLLALSYRTLKSTFQFLSCGETINAFNADGNTPLHLYLQNKYYDYALDYYPGVDDLYFDLLQFLLELGASRDICNKKGEFPIHIACEHQCSIKSIEIVGTTGITERTINGDNVFHKACRNCDVTLEVLEYLVNEMGETSFLSKCNNDGNLPLHLSSIFARDERIFKFMLQSKCDITAKNNDGNTPLHLLVSRGYFEEPLNDLLQGGLDVTLCNNDGENTLDLVAKQQGGDFRLAQKIVTFYLSDPKKLSHILSCASDKFTTLLLLYDTEMVKILIDHGIDPAPLYKVYETEVGAPQVPISLLFIGDSMTGKTTLVNSLQREAGLNPSVEPFDHTAGIISNRFMSNEYGQVNAYDFAGQREYYAGHEAVMQRIIQKLPPIILLHVKLEITSISEKEIEKRIIYWSNFIKNRLKHLSSKAHLIIVCSHADLVIAPEQISQRIRNKLKSKLLEITVFELIDVIHMDCRSSEGPSITHLVSTLTKSSNKLRHKGVINFNAHCFYAFLNQHFKNHIAISLGNLFRQISPFKQEKMLAILPKKVEDLMDLCEELASNGQILLLRENLLQRSWIILNEQVLLNEVSGKIFAPINFTNHEELMLSETGLVAFSTIKSIFPQYNPNMIFSFLCALECCYEIHDDVTLTYIFNQENITLSDGDKYYFFPGLVTIDRPRINWGTEESIKSCQFGWVLKSRDSFTPKFIQTLLLRLIFGSTTIKPISSNICKIGSISKIWKSGLFWFDSSGIDTIVDVVDTASKVIVLMRCTPENDVNLLKHRSSLMTFVRELQKEICSLTTTNEYFVSSINQCLATIESDDKYLISASEICSHIRQSESHIPTVHGNFEISKIVLFDAYSCLCKQLIVCICKKDYRDKQIPIQFLNQLTDHLYNMRLETSVELFGICITSLSQHSCHPVQIILQVLKIWREERKGTFGSLKLLFDSISVLSRSSEYSESDDIPCILNCLKHNCDYVENDDEMFMTHPTLSNLTLIKWTDWLRGETHRLKIIESISCDWMKVGTLLGQSWVELERFRRMFNNDIFDCCRSVMDCWLRSQRTCSQEYPVTWQGLHVLLCDISYGTAAMKLKEALESKGLHSLLSAPQ